jgi:hypothetical protein
VTNSRAILAVDPGPTESAYLWLRDGMPTEFAKESNEVVLEICQDAEIYPLTIEKVASYGMPVGAEVFETVFWSGRFAQAYGGEVSRIPRTDVKMHLCHTIKGVNDSVIRQALIDRYGPGKEVAIGTKKQPGPLYGIKADCWAALALAVTFWDKSTT